MSNLRLGWIGFHVEGQPAFQALLESGIRIEAAFTLREEASAKRSGVCRYDELCARHGVPLHKIGHVNDPETVALLKQLNLDVVFVIGWSQIIGGEALRAARIGMIGAHASPLPHNRGSAPVNWAIIRGETEGGNTLIWLADNVDQGDIIDQVRFPITPYDTCATVYEKVAHSNREMILRLIPRLQRGERPSRPQPATGEPILPRRRPEHGSIDWRQSSREVYDFIRALTHPYPGAFSRLEGRRYFIWKAALLPGEPYPAASPGTVVGPALSPESGACGQVVACGKGAVLLLEVQSEDGETFAGIPLSQLPWKEKVWTHE
ncbi:MAG: methionyl-tRNA formyltransferase [Pirellulales bacterium]|nr:methionyl-tRNA formyltransferase [Pirellulales bacterium]